MKLWVLENSQLMFKITISQFQESVRTTMLMLMLTVSVMLHCFMTPYVQGLQIWLRKIIRFWERWIFIKCFFYIHRNFPYAGRFLKITDQGSFLLLSFNLSSMCWGARNWQISPKMDKFDKKNQKFAKFSQMETQEMT